MFDNGIAGCSVTTRIKRIHQPRGGFLNPKSFEVIDLQAESKNKKELNPEETLSPSIMGLLVDYLTRFMIGENSAEAFFIPSIGATNIGKRAVFNSLLKKVEGLDDESIIAAAKICGFDCVYRAGPLAYRPIEDFVVDKATIENVRTMVERSLYFFDRFGPKTLDGLTFEGGYTDKITIGDGDFLTSDTLWDFKVSKLPLKSNQTLQILIYWRMGLHSKHKSHYLPIKYLGIYNPRLNLVYRIATSQIPEDVIANVDTDVIGY